MTEACLTRAGVGGLGGSREREDAGRGPEGACGTADPGRDGVLGISFLRRNSATTAGSTVLGATRESLINSNFLRISRRNISDFP